MTILPNSPPFYADGGKECIYKTKWLCGALGLAGLLLCPPGRLKAGVSATIETRYQRQQSKDRSDLEPRGPCGTATPIQNCWSPCFLDLTALSPALRTSPNPSRLFMADPYSIMGTQVIPFYFSWRWIIRKGGLVTQKATSITF